MFKFNSPYSSNEGMRLPEDFPTEDWVDQYLAGNEKALDQISKRPDAYEAIARKLKALEIVLRQSWNKEDHEETIRAQAHFDAMKEKLEELQTKLAELEQPLEDANA